MTRLRVLVVDDHEVVRMGLRTLLGQHPSIEVVGEAATAAEALAKVGSLDPDIVLLDVRLPGRSGIEACRQIKADHPETRVVMITSFSEDQALFDAIAAGADGFVLKQIGSDELVQALQRVGNGQNLLDQSLTSQVFSRLRELREQTEGVAFADLSEQELQILALVAQGQTNREIGESLYLSEKTVRNHVSNILAKLGLTSRVQAAAYAARHRIERYVT